MKHIEQIIGKIFESKTYGLLILISFIALLACLIAAAFGEMLWAKYVDFLTIQSGFGGARGIANDGVPKMIEAVKSNGHKEMALPPPYNPNEFPRLD